MKTVRFEDLKSIVGWELGPSEWIEVTQDMIDRFADVTRDHQWIHVDIERAKREMGGTIAHGFLTVSLMPVMAYGLLEIEGVTRAINYGFDKLRFTNVVRPGQSIRLRQKVLEVEEKSGGVSIKRESVVEIDGEERPALISEWIGVVYG